MNVPASPLLRALAALVVVLLLGMAAWMRHGFDHAELDPDRPYHFAVSRQAASSGVVRTLPQVRGLGWDKAFADKEFLFHVVTGMAWRLGGEPATAAVAPLLAVAVLGTLAVAASSVAGPAAAVLGVGAALLCNPEAAPRLLLLRPHVLAMLCFSLLAWALVRRSRAGVAIAAFAFSLAYHAVFVPAALLGVVFLYGFRGGNTYRVLALWGGAGIGLGILLNPYFPENVLLGLTHLQLALDPALGTTVDIGLESVPVRSDTFLGAWGFALAVLVSAAVVLRVQPADAEPTEPVATLEWMAAALVLFIALTLKNPRAGEYAAPLTVMALAAVVRVSPRARAPLAWAALPLALVPAWGFWGRPLPVQPRLDVEMARAAAAAIPADASGQLVFNCEWHRSSYVIHARPDVAVLDVLEPKLLAAHAPVLSGFRAALMRGEVADPAVFLRGVAGAAYVLCQSPSVVAQLEADPAFQRVFPADDGVAGIPRAQPRLYRVLPVPAAFVTRYVGTVQGLLPVDGLAEVTPALPGERVPMEQWVAEGVARPFLDLRAFAAPVNAPMGAPIGTCAVVSPAAEELQRLRGATVLGLGGGRVLRVFVDGAPLFRTTAALADPRTLSVLVPLASPITGAERVEVVACSGDAQPYLGLSLSFWTQEQLAQACADKAPRGRDGPVPAGAFAYTGTTRTTCLAPWAATPPP